MKSVLPLLAAAAIALPSLAFANEPAPKADEQSAAPKAPEKICKRVSLDISSRKKEEVCLTAEGWRTFNRQQQ